VVVLLLGYRIFGAFGPWEDIWALRHCARQFFPGQARMLPFLALLFGLSLSGQGCPHEGSDHRLLGRVGCPIQRKLTIEGARPPRTIWSFHLLKISVKVDPKHPHRLIEWPARSQRLWRFRVGLPLGCQRESLYLPFPSAKEGGWADAGVPNGLATASQADLKKYI
jgi:hypothetical protein